MSESYQKVLDVLDLSFALKAEEDAAKIIDERNREKLGFGQVSGSITDSNNYEVLDGDTVRIFEDKVDENGLSKSFDLRIDEGLDTYETDIDKYIDPETGERTEQYYADAKQYADTFGVTNQGGFFEFNDVQPEQLVDAGLAAKQNLKDSLDRQLTERGQIDFNHSGTADEYGRALGSIGSENVNNNPQLNAGYNSRYNALQRLKDLQEDPDAYLSKQKARKAVNKNRWHRLATDQILNLVNGGLNLGIDFVEASSLTFTGLIDILSDSSSTAWLDKKFENFKDFKDIIIEYGMSDQRLARIDLNEDLSELNAKIFDAKYKQLVESGETPLTARVKAGIDQSGNVFRQLAQNPSQVLDLTVETIPYMLGIAASGRVVTSKFAAKRFANKKKNLRNEDGSKLSKLESEFRISELGLEDDFSEYASKFSRNSAIGAIGVTEGMSAGNAAVDRVLGMSEQQAMESEKYQALRFDDGLTHEEALTNLAVWAGAKTFGGVAVAASLAGTLVGRFEGNLFRSTTLLKETVRKAPPATKAQVKSIKQRLKNSPAFAGRFLAKAANNPATRETVEEGLQSAAGDIIPALAVQSGTGIDQNVGRSTGEAVAVGAVAGGVSGGAAALGKKGFNKVKQKIATPNKDAVVGDRNVSTSSQKTFDQAETFDKAKTVEELDSSAKSILEDESLNPLEQEKAAKSYLENVERLESSVDTDTARTARDVLEEVSRVRVSGFKQMDENASPEKITFLGENITQEELNKIAETRGADSKVVKTLGPLAEANSTVENVKLKFSTGSAIEDFAKSQGISPAKAKQVLNDILYREKSSNGRLGLPGHKNKVISLLKNGDTKGAQEALENFDNWVKFQEDKSNVLKEATRIGKEEGVEAANKFLKGQTKHRNLKYIEGASEDGGTVGFQKTTEDIAKQMRKVFGELQKALNNFEAETVNLPTKTETAKEETSTENRTKEEVSQPSLFPDENKTEQTEKTKETEKSAEKAEEKSVEKTTENATEETVKEPVKEPAKEPTEEIVEDSSEKTPTVDRSLFDAPAEEETTNVKSKVLEEDNPPTSSTSPGVAPSPGASNSAKNFGENLVKDTLNKLKISAKVLIEEKPFQSKQLRRVFGYYNPDTQEIAISVGRIIEAYFNGETEAEILSDEAKTKRLKGIISFTLMHELFHKRFEEKTLSLTGKELEERQKILSTAFQNPYVRSLAKAIHQSRETNEPFEKEKFLWVEEALADIAGTFPLKEKGADRLIETKYGKYQEKAYAGLPKSFAQAKLDDLIDIAKKYLNFLRKILSQEISDTVSDEEVIDIIKGFFDPSDVTPVVSEKVEIKLTEEDKKLYEKIKRGESSLTLEEEKEFFTKLYRYVSEGSHKEYVNVINLLGITSEEIIDQNINKPDVVANLKEKSEKGYAPKKLRTVNVELSDEQLKEALNDLEKFAENSAENSVGKNFLEGRFNPKKVSEAFLDKIWNLVKDAKDSENNDIFSLAEKSQKPDKDVYKKIRQYLPVFFRNNKITERLNQIVSSKKKAKTLLQAIPNLNDALKDSRFREAIAEKLDLNISQVNSYAAYLDLFTSRFQKQLLDLDPTNSSNELHALHSKSKNGKASLFVERMQENPLLLLTDVNGQFGTNQELETAIAMSLLSWISENGQGSVNKSLETIASELTGSSENTNDVKGSLIRLRYGKGVRRNTLADNLGKRILNNLGLEDSKTNKLGLDAKSLEKFTESLGLYAIDLAIDANIFGTPVQIPAYEAYLDSLTTTEKENTKELARKKEELEGKTVEYIAPKSEKDITELTEDELSRNAFDGVFELNSELKTFIDFYSTLNDKSLATFGVENNSSMPQNAPSNKSRANLGGNFKTRVESNNQKILRKANSRAYVFPEKLEKAFSKFAIFGNQFAEIVMGSATEEEIENAHVDLKEGKQAAKDNRIRSFNAVFDFMEILKTDLYGGKFFNDRKISRVGRAQSTNNGIDVQNDTLHRWIFRQEAWPYKVNTYDREQIFLASIGEALIKIVNPGKEDLSVDQYALAVENFYKDTRVLEILDSLQKEQLSEKEVLAIFNLAKEGGEKAHSLAALIELSEYLNRDPNSEFVTDFPVERDGKSNGIAHTALQTPFDDDAVANGVGIPTEGKNEKALDPYQLVAKEIYAQLRDLVRNKTFQEQKKTVSVNEVLRALKANNLFTEKVFLSISDLIQLKELLESLKAVPDVNQELENFINSEGRNFTKLSTTQTGYMAGPSTVMQAIVDEVLEKIKDNIVNTSKEEYENQLKILVKIVKIVDSNLSSEDETLRNDFKKLLKPYDKRNETNFSGIETKLKIAIGTLYGLTTRNALEKVIGSALPARKAMIAANSTQQLLAFLKLEHMKANYMAQNNEAPSKEIIKEFLERLNKEEVLPQNSGLNPNSQPGENTVISKTENIFYNASDFPNESDLKSRVTFDDKISRGVTVELNEQGFPQIVKTAPQQTVSNGLNSIQLNLDLGVIAGVYSNLAQDGLNMLEILDKHEITDVFDAIVASPLLAEEAAKTADKAFIEINSNYDAFADYVRQLKKLINTVKTEHQINKGSSVRYLELENSSNKEIPYGDSYAQKQVLAAYTAFVGVLIPAEVPTNRTRVKTSTSREDYVDFLLAILTSHRDLYGEASAQSLFNRLRNRVEGLQNSSEILESYFEELYKMNWKSQPVPKNAGDNFLKLLSNFAERIEIVSQKNTEKKKELLSKIDKEKVNQFGSQKREEGEPPKAVSPDSDSTFGASIDPIRAEQFELEFKDKPTSETIKSIVEVLRSMENKVGVSPAQKVFFDELIETLLVPGLKGLDQLELNLGFIKNGTRNAGSFEGNTITVQGTKNKITSPVDMSLEEVFLHETVHAITVWAIETNPKFRSQLESLYTQVKNDPSINSSVFLAGITNPTAYEVDQAQKRYDYIFNSGPGKNRKDLAEFLAIALTNEQLANGLKNVTVENASVTEAGSDLFSKVLNFIKSVLDFFKSESYKESQKTNVSEALQKLVFDVNSIRSKYENNIFQNLVTNLTSASDKEVQEFVERATNKIKQYYKGRNPGEVDGIIKSTKYAITSLAQANVDSVEQVWTDFARQTNDIVVFREITEILEEVGIPSWTKEKRNWVNLLAKSFNKVDTARQQAIATAQKALLDSYENGRLLSNEVKSSITNVVLKTDLQSLLERRSPREILELLKNTESLRNEEQSILAEIRNTLSRELPNNNGRYFRWLNAQSEGLAELMLGTGGHQDHQSKNATVLVKAFTAPKTLRPELSEKTEAELIQLIEELVTVRATRKVDPAHLENVIPVFEQELNRNEELNGFVHTLAEAKAHVQTSLKTSFKDNPYNMVKGYSYEVYDEDVTLETAPDTVKSRAEMEQRGFVYVSPLERNEHDTSGLTNAALFVSNKGQATWNKSIVSYTNAAKAGSSIFESFVNSGVDKNKSAKIAGMEVARLQNIMFKKAGKQFGKANRSKGPIPVPVLDTKGEIVDYTYMMLEDTKKSLLKKNDNIDEVLPRTLATAIDRQESKSINREVIEMLFDEYAQAVSPGEDGIAAEPTTNFIVISPNSKDPRAREIWRILPSDTKRYAEEKFEGKRLIVRPEFVNLIFGFRKLSIANDKFWGPGTWFVKTAESLWQEMLGLLRFSIAITTPEVVVGNLVSNTAILLTEKIPVKFIQKETKNAVQALRIYQNEFKALEDIKVKIRTQAALGKNVSSLERREAELEANLANNPVAELIDRGLFTSITEDLNFSNQRVSKKFLNKTFGDRKNKNLQLAGQALAETYMLPGSSLGNAATLVTQYTDFVARYVKFKYDTDVRKNDKNTSAQEALQTFIYYNMPQNRWLQFANDNGFMMFTKFFLRIQPVVFRLFKQNPATAMGVFGAQQMLRNIAPAPFDGREFSDNIFSQTFGFTDRLSYKFDLNPFLTNFEKTDPLSPPLIDLLKYFIGE